MANHIHALLRAPEGNLSELRDEWLGMYARWFNRKSGRVGHLFQGRFKGELIEDEQYFWNVSRHVHLNPVRGKRPLVERPEQWRWSS